MDERSVRDLLNGIRDGQISPAEGVERIKELYYKDLGYAKIDNQRESRIGHPEVIYSEGKTNEQIEGIIAYMLKSGKNILATRASEEVFLCIKAIAPDAEYNKMARTVVIRRQDVVSAETYIAIVTGGTSDVPVAEEAAVTAELRGNRVVRVYDVGVAGIHRLFDNLSDIRGARAVVVIAGMEGALASVVGGLVDKPVIAVPTSIGYGANFGGLSALLSMLNSCASGVCVVNIDNGFGAGCLASMINRLTLEDAR